MTHGRETCRVKEIHEPWTNHNGPYLNFVSNKQPIKKAIMRLLHSGNIKKLLLTLKYDNGTVVLCWVL